MRLAVLGILMIGAAGAVFGDVTYDFSSVSTTLGGSTDIVGGSDGYALFVDNDNVGSDGAYYWSRSGGMGSLVSLSAIELTTDLGDGSFLIRNGATSLREISSSGAGADMPGRPATQLYGAGNGQALAFFDTATTDYSRWYDGSGGFADAGMSGVTAGDLIGNGSVMVKNGGSLVNISGATTQTSYTRSEDTIYGAGNGLALVTLGTDSYTRWYTGSGFEDEGLWDVALADGLGDGTVLAIGASEDDGTKGLYHVSGAGKTLYTGFSDVTDIVGLGDGTALMEYSDGRVFLFDGDSVEFLTDTGATDDYNNPDRIIGLGDGTALLDYGDNVYMVPEPATLGMMGLGALAMLVLRRRMK